MVKSLQGMVFDWSDTECSGLVKTLGSELATNFLQGYGVHWARSNQRFAACVAPKYSTETKLKSSFLKHLNAMHNQCQI